MENENIYGELSTFNHNGKNYKLVDSFLREQLQAPANKLDSYNFFDIIYPRGSIYWTSDSTFNPNTRFNGTWVQLKDVYVYAASNDADVDNTKIIKESATIDGKESITFKYNTLGSSEIELNQENIPKHTHKVSGTHAHEILGNNDDYNGSHSKGQWPGFVNDAPNQKFGQNTYQKYEDDNKTSIFPRYPNNPVYTDRVRSDDIVKLDGWGSDNPTPINISPKHVSRYCWERIE